MNRWQQLENRYAALQTREQLMVVGAAIVLVLALCDSLLWSPLSGEKTAQSSQLTQLQKKRDELRVQRVEVDAKLEGNLDKRTNDDIHAVQADLEIVNKRLDSMTTNMITPSLMPDALRDLIAAQKKVKLLALENEVSAQQKADKDSKDSAKTDQSDTAGIYKHGLKVTLRGEYFDVLTCLQAIEALPWNFFWEALDYRVDRYPEAEVTIRVYTLGNKKEWIGA